MINNINWFKFDLVTAVLDGKYNNFNDKKIMMSKTCRRYLLVWLCCWITRISGEKKTKRAIFGRRVNYFWPASLKASAVTHRHEWLPRVADYERLQGCYWLRFLTRDGSNHPPGISSSEAHSIPVGSSTTKWTQVLVSKDKGSVVLRVLEEVKQDHLVYKTNYYEF